MAGLHTLDSVTGEGCFPAFVERLPVARAALAYAEPMHRGQERPDGTPFILHPLEVASLLYHLGAPDYLVAAGVMHDLLEKTTATASELLARFGPRVTGLVVSVSDDDRIPAYSERKAALRDQVAEAGEEALTLFAADKLSKLRELQREAANGCNDCRCAPEAREQRARRLRHYQRSLALLQERLPGSPLVYELRDELTSFVRQRAPARGDGRRGATGERHVSRH